MPYGHPNLVLRPLVIHPAVVPQVTDPEQARRLPELAVLSAIVHRNSPQAAQIGWALMVGSESVADDKRKLYLDVVMAGLNEVARRELEKTMQGYQYQSEFARKYVAEGLAKGRLEGRVEGLVLAALRLVENKAGTLPRGLAKRLAQGHDADELQQLVVDLGVAPDAAAIREVLARHDLSPPRRKTTSPPPAPQRTRTRRKAPSTSSRR